MTKRTVEQVKASAAEMLASNEITGEDIKAKSALVNFNLTPEQVAFCIASTEDDLSDDGWRTLLTECYTGTEQGVVDAAWNMTGFDGTDEQKASMTPYIEAFHAAHGRAPNLSPNALFAVLTDEGNQAENDTMDEWLDCIEQAEPEDEGDTDGTSNVAIIQEAEQSAIKVAGLLTEDAEFIGNLNRITDSQAFLKIAPLLLMQNLEKRLGGDQMLAAPEPGSISRDATGKETFLPMVGNTIYDIYKVPGKGKRKVRMSFYGTIFKTLPPGKEVIKELALLDEGDAKTGPYSNAGGWSQFRRDSWRNTVTQRLNNGTKAIRTAFALHRQLEWLRSFPGCHIEPIMDGTDVARVSQPFWLSPVKADGTPNAGMGESYSIGGVLAFNRAKTENNGNTYEALIKSTERKPKPPAPPVPGAVVTQPTAQATEVGLIVNMPQLNAYASMVAHFYRDLAEADMDKPIVKDFTKELATNDDLALSLRDMVRFADYIRARVEVRVRSIEAKEVQARGNGNGKNEITLIQKKDGTYA